MTKEQLEYYRNLIKNPSEEDMQRLAENITDDILSRAKETKRRKHNSYHKARYLSEKSEFGRVYMIVNEITGAIYVGSTTNGIKKRLYQHRTMSKDLKRKSKLYQDMRFYGTENFAVELLCELTGPEESLKRVEQGWIERLKAELNQNVAKI